MMNASITNQNTYYISNQTQVCFGETSTTYRIGQHSNHIHVKIRINIFFHLN